MITILHWWFGNYVTGIVGTAALVLLIVGSAIGALITSDWNQPCYTKDGGCK